MSEPAPASREAGAQQGPRLPTHGHQFGKPYDDGYAVCQRCGTREDSKIAGKPCLGPRSERPSREAENVVDSAYTYAAQVSGKSREAEIAARLLAEAFALREGKSELTVDETADLLTEASDLLAQLQQARQERDAVLANDRKREELWQGVIEKRNEALRELRLARQERQEILDDARLINEQTVGVMQSALDRQESIINAAKAWGKAFRKRRAALMSKEGHAGSPMESLDEQLDAADESLLAALKERD